MKFCRVSDICLAFTINELTRLAHFPPLERAAPRACARDLPQARGVLRELVLGYCRMRIDNLTRAAPDRTQDDCQGPRSGALNLRLGCLMPNDEGYYTVHMEKLEKILLSTESPRLDSRLKRRQDGASRVTTRRFESLARLQSRLVVEARWRRETMVTGIESSWGHDERQSRLAHHVLCGDGESAHDSLTTETHLRQPQLTLTLWDGFK